MKYLFLPFLFLKFWFVESPINLLQFFASVNNSFFQLFSLPLLFKTFFQPIKNEYRPGLVGFSKAIGMVIKSFFIIADVIILALLLITEISIFVSFIVFPIATIALLFY